MKALRYVRNAWAIEYTSSPLDGFRRSLGGVPDHPCRTRLFETRAEAKRWLADEKRRSRWAFTGAWACDCRGGNRIYKNARVVAVRITVEVV